MSRDRDEPCETAPQPPAGGVNELLPSLPDGGLRERLALAAAFARCALRYWLLVFPRTRRVLRRQRRRAARIPDPALREAALAALVKHGNVEGAVAFAAALPGRHGNRLVRALAYFQLIYNYVDMLAEQPNAQPVLNARRLHAALLVALDPDAPHHDYYAFHGRHEDDSCEDGGYLAQTVDACREALRGLPTYPAVAVRARAATARIVSFQSLSLGERSALERWARTLMVADPLRDPADGALVSAGPKCEPLKPAKPPLAWWEAAAAAGSSVAVHALIAAAAVPALGAEDFVAIEAAYWPWAGALHSLLDSAVDRAEDAAAGQLSLVCCYRSEHEAALRMRWLAARARAAARALPRGRRHVALVTAMACNYLSAPELAARAGDAAPAAVGELAAGVRAALGGLATPALAVFRVWRRRRRSAGGAGADAGASVAGALPVRPAVALVPEQKRGVDARAA
jgi:tetraprenyl-beta-curcumene synthase